jgi:DNA-binding transcriptional LysR family regulator
MSETRVDYDLLAIFVAVASEASFSKAAIKLGLGKGTVSRGIARLEETLGTELIHRTTHKVTLSTAGTALYERTASHLAALEQAVKRLPERAEEPSGVLRIAAPHDFAAIVLPELLSRFALRYPEVVLDIRIANARVDLVAEGIDLAVRIAAGPWPDSSLTIRRVSAAAASCYAAPQYLLRRGRPKEYGDERHEWIVHRALEKHWKTARATNARFVCDDFLVLRGLACSEAGIAAMPDFVAAPLVRDGSLEAVAVTGLPTASASVFVAYPSSGQVPRKVAAFRDFLVARMKQAPIS